MSSFQGLILFVKQGVGVLSGLTVYHFITLW